MCKWLAVWCTWAVLAATALGAVDKAPPAEKTSAGRGGVHDAEKARKQARPAPGFTPEREAAAIEFVRRHHPELAALLAHLKKAEAAEYRRAVSTLFRTSERLAHTQERDPKKHERELKAWKLKSRIQLLVAKIRMTPEDEKLRQTLRRALLEQYDLRGTQLAEDRKKLAERIEKLDAQIKNMHRDRDSDVERQFELLLREKKKRPAPGKGNRGKAPAGRDPSGGNKQPT